MVVPLSSFNIKIDINLDTHILDIHFIPHSNSSVFEWINSLAEILSMATQNNCSISIVSAWISDTLFDTSFRNQCKLYLQTTLSEHWTFRIQNYILTYFGLQLFGISWCVQLQRIGRTQSFYHTEVFLPCRNRMRDVSMALIIDESLNTSLKPCIVLPYKDK